MADEATSANAPEIAPDQQGQANRTSEGKPAEGRNLYDDPNFRKLQAQWQQKYDSVVAQANQMRSKLEQMEEAGVDDYGKLELKLRRAEEQVQQYQQWYQQVEQDRQEAERKDAALDYLAKKFKVERSALASAEDYEQALDMAIKLAEERARNRENESDSRRQRNRPDLGGGNVSTPPSRWDAERKKAKTATELARLWFQAPD